MRCSSCGCASLGKRFCPQCKKSLAFELSGGGQDRPDSTVIRARPDDGIAWRPLAIGIVLGSLVAAWGGFPFRIFQTLSVLIHELGHAMMAWMVGRPAIPKFDLQYGGGITPFGERSMILCLLLAIAAVWMLWLARERGSRWFVAAIAIVAFPCLLILTDTDIKWIVAAGHVAQPIMAVVFLVRAATGIGISHTLEAGVSAMTGTAMWWDVQSFAWNLIHDPNVQECYSEGKAGLDGDLTRLAEEVGGTVTAWAWAYLIFALIALFVGALVVAAIRRYRLQQHYLEG